MKTKEIQIAIDNSGYEDARLNRLECNYFGDEVELAYDDTDTIDKEVQFLFTGCYKYIYNHVEDYDKIRPSKDMTFPQIPYFIQSVVFNEVIIDDKKLYSFKLNIFPIYIEILCEKLIITKQQRGKGVQQDIVTITE